MEYCIAAASSPFAPPNCSRSMLPKRRIGFANPDGVHEFFNVVVHDAPLCSSFSKPCPPLSHGRFAEHDPRYAARNRPQKNTSGGLRSKNILIPRSAGSRSKTAHRWAESGALKTRTSFQSRVQFFQMHFIDDDIKVFPTDVSAETVRTFSTLSNRRWSPRPCP